MLAHQVVLSNVRVLAIGQNVQEENGKKVVVGGNATLELDPKQAEIVIYAQHTAGSQSASRAAQPRRQFRRRDRDRQRSVGGAIQRL